MYKRQILLSALGLRRSEALGVRWSDINFAESSLAIRRKVVPLKGKSASVIDVLKSKSSNRIISIPDFVLSELRGIRDRHMQNSQQYECPEAICDFVCVNASGRILNPCYVTHTLLEIVRKNHLKKITIKGLRHTCATLISAQGFNLKYVQEWLGHSTITITANIYTHIDMQDKAIVAHSLQDKIFSEKEPSETAAQ